jgi:hypothetical protein
MLILGSAIGRAVSYAENGMSSLHSLQIVVSGTIWGSRLEMLSPNAYFNRRDASLGIYMLYINISALKIDLFLYSLKT